MQVDLGALLAARGLSSAEYAVLWHIVDTVVCGRDALADWVSHNLPNNIPQGLSTEDCLRAIDALIDKGFVVELTRQAIDDDVARWRAEPLPVSWGVDLRREPGDLDVTAAGFHMFAELSRTGRPNHTPPRIVGYDARTSDTIRVLGNTEEACREHAAHMLVQLAGPPWHWLPASTVVEPVRAIGPWWHSRHERMPDGFEIVVRRRA